MKMDHQCNQVLMFRKKLKSRLDPMRYEHSLSVSFTCMNLAMRYGYDIDKADVQSKYIRQSRRGRTG